MLQVSDAADAPMHPPATSFRHPAVLPREGSRRSGRPPSATASSWPTSQGGPERVHPVHVRILRRSHAEWDPRAMPSLRMEVRALLLCISTRGAAAREPHFQVAILV